MTPTSAQISEQGRAARDTLRALAVRPDAVVLAVATNGLHGEVIQACTWECGRAGGNLEFNDYARPLGAFDRAAARYHGLTEAFLHEAPDFATLAAGLREALAGKVVLVFNVTYAADCLNTTCERRGVPVFDTAAWVDVQALASRNYGTFNATHGNFTLLSMHAALQAAGLAEGPDYFEYPPKAAAGVAERVWAFVTAHRQRGDDLHSPAQWPAITFQTDRGPVRLTTDRDWI